MSKLELVEDNPNRLISSVLTGLADVALVGVAGQTPEHLGSHVIASESLVAMVPPDSPLATERTVPLIELMAYALVTLPEGTGIRAAFDEGPA